MHAAKLGREAHVSVDGVRVLDPGAGDKDPAVAMFSLELELVKAPKASSFKKLRRASSSKSFQEL